MSKLQKILQNIDGKSYGAYKDIKGSYEFENFVLRIDHVQGDPFAAPSRISLRIPQKVSLFPSDLFSNTIRKTALCDYLTRILQKNAKKYIKGNRGSGKSGLVDVAHCGQQVLQRNSIIMDKDVWEIRLVVGLPAAGRKILGRQAIDIFYQELPKLVELSLLYESLNANQIMQHIESVEDQEFLRNWLPSENLVAFIADGSILPRRSGVDDRPLENGKPFVSPADQQISVNLPNGGEVKGLGIKRGITLIVGGGFHGKSTLLRALELGIYNHIVGDGREKVVTDPSAMKIRAEDGRIINHVDISPFINNLPLGRSTKDFFTENASGSTSQAANIVEALQGGSKLLLIDEDTSATNFMIRDERMQALVSDDKEPITPLVHRVRELYEQNDISSIIVMGGSGDYFSISDCVIMMDAYEPSIVTEKARALAGDKPPKGFADRGFVLESRRKIAAKLLDPAKGKRDEKIDVRGLDLINYGQQEIDLSKVEQLVSVHQAQTIGLIMAYYARKKMDCGMVEGINKVLDQIKQDGLDVVSPVTVGNLALPRVQEITAAINRLRIQRYRP